MVSKYCKAINVKDDIFAIFNTLVMDIIYVNKEELEDIYNDNMKSDISTLKKAGIIIDSQERDKRALDSMLAQYSIHTKKIAIMYLILSSGCNLGCKYCFIENNENNNFSNLNMSSDIVEAAVNKYLDYIKTEKVEKPLILFYGGEPTLNIDAIKKTVELVKQSNTSVDYSIVTNGTLLTRDVVEFFAENNIEVGISIDGPKEVNDFNRVFRASKDSVYDSVVEGIKLLKECGVKFGLSITVSDYFLNNKDEIFQWLKNIGVNGIFYNLLHFTYNETKDVWEPYYQKGCEYLIVSHEELSSYGINDGRIGRKIESLFEGKFKFGDCAAIGANQITVKPNGDLCVCHGELKTDKYVVGNIKDVDLKELAKTKEFEFWEKATTLYKEECLSCEALFICGRGCPTQAEAIFRSRESLDIPFCMHSKRTLKWLLEKGYESLDY